MGLPLSCNTLSISDMSSLFDPLSTLLFFGPTEMSTAVMLHCWEERVSDKECIQNRPWLGIPSEQLSKNPCFQMFAPDLFPIPPYFPVESYNLEPASYHSLDSSLLPMAELAAREGDYTNTVLDPHQLLFSESSSTSVSSAFTESEIRFPSRLMGLASLLLLL